MKRYLPLLAALAGCSLNSEQKISCQTQTDCLDGYACAGSICVARGDGGVTLADAPSSGDDYGVVQALAPATAGVSVVGDYYTLAGVSSTTGSLACAMLAHEDAAPGTETALAYAKVDKGEAGGDTRCPSGSFAIVDDPSCKVEPVTGLRPGCAIYKRWDASGTQVANRRAIGGYVAIQNTPSGQDDQRCDVDLSLRFAGGVTIAKAFSFHYNPLAPAEAFCVPQ